MPKHEAFLARTSPSTDEDTERRAREQAFLEAVPEAYGLDLSNLAQDPNGQWRLMVMPGRRDATSSTIEAAPNLIDGIRKEIQQNIITANHDAEMEAISDDNAQERWQVIQDTQGVGTIEEWEEDERTQRQAQETAITNDRRNSRGSLI